MLSRRHIRIKVLQALYSFYRDEEHDQVLAQRALQRSLDRIYELYIYDISTLREVLKVAEERIEIARNKLRPTPEDLNPNLAFVNNQVLKLIANNVRLNKQIEERHISWNEYSDTFKKIYNRIREDEHYQKYMLKRDHGFAEDKKLVKHIYANYICNNEFFHQLYEDLYIHWADDLDAAQMMTTKTIKTMKDSSNEFHPLVKLFKDKDDETFGPLLFRKVVANSDYYEKLIAERTRNWESDRIAIVDNLLMRMALAELTSFEEIPVKVTLNEYIELSKEYSTPKSAIFINGVLDKLVADLQEKNEIVKVGRGLL